MDEGDRKSVQHDLQAMMQEQVGIVRQEDEMRDALTKIAGLRERAARAGVGGNREFNSGWHTAMDLHSLLTVSEAVARAGIERKESRGAHFRDDYPAKSDEFSRFNFVITKGSDGAMQLERVPLPPRPDELTLVIEENK